MLRKSTSRIFIRKCGGITPILKNKVQSNTFLKLILDYSYAQERIKQFVPVTMGTAVKEANIIVYNDDQYLSPRIVVECKKEDISELEFVQAVEQVFSYAVVEGAKYVWMYYRFVMIL